MTLVIDPFRPMLPQPAARKRQSWVSATLNSSVRIQCNTAVTVISTMHFRETGANLERVRQPYQGQSLTAPGQLTTVE